MREHEELYNGKVLHIEVVKRIKKQTPNPGQNEPEVFNATDAPQSTPARPTLSFPNTIEIPSSSGIKRTNTGEKMTPVTKTIEVADSNGANKRKELSPTNLASNKDTKKNRMSTNDSLEDEVIEEDDSENEETPPSQGGAKE